MASVPPKLGPWIVGESLGQGGMGRVYRARHEKTGAAAALKVVDPQFARDERLMVRFRREAQAAGDVHHPSLIAYLGFGNDQGLFWLALELADGGSLQGKLRKDGPLGWREAARVGAEIARGLEAMHGRGIFHRDLKPGNVLLDAQGHAKLADFGLVRRTDSGRLTSTGELVGTVEFMAPEQTEGKGDARSDLYALGCTITCLVTGQPPFPGTGAEVLTRHLTQAPPALRRRVADVPPALEALVLELLAKDPARRGKAGEVAARLEAIAAGRVERSRAPLVLTFALMFIVGAGLAGAWAFTHQRPSTPSAPLVPPPPPPPPEKPPAPSVPRWFEELSPKPSLPPGLTPGAKIGEYVLAKDGSVLVYVPEVLVTLGASEDDPQRNDEEKPEHKVVLSPYFMGKYKVTTAAFRKFVEAARYSTRAERKEFPAPTEDDLHGDEGRYWWWDGPRIVELSMKGVNYVPDTTANWRKPWGAKGPAAKDLDPVLQVAWEDAVSYAKWAGVTLPSEAQWECAARWDPATGGTTRYPWGDDPPEPSRARYYTFGVTAETTIGPAAEALNVSHVGAVQMAGNAREWVLDEFVHDHGWLDRTPPVRDPVARSGIPHYCTKGGSCREIPSAIRGSHRQTAVGSDDRTTFRIAIRAP